MRASLAGCLMPHPMGRLGLLDPYSDGLWGAYGRIVLRGNYFGPVVRLRRNVAPFDEVDFGFVDDVTSYAPLDWAAIAAWIGSDTAQVRRWYDQSGSGAYLNRPIIDSSVIVDDGDEIVRFVGTGGSINSLITSNSSGSPTAITTALCIVPPFGANDQELFYGLGNPVPGGTKGGYVGYNPNNAPATFDTRMQDSNGTGYGRQYDMGLGPGFSHIFTVLQTVWQRPQVSPVVAQATSLIIDGATGSEVPPNIGNSAVAATFDPQTWTLGSWNGGDSIEDLDVRLFAIWERALDAAELSASQLTIAGGA